jgi:hypothetical protein
MAAPWIVIRTRTAIATSIQRVLHEHAANDDVVM